MCILFYIGNHIWDIIQTLIGIIALCFAYFAWQQYRKDKQIEYWKIDYQLSKDIYDYYSTDKNIAKLIDMGHKEAEDIPDAKIRCQDNMVVASHNLQKLLIPFVYKGIKFPDEIDSGN